jgi:hypothetical protein
LFIFLFLWGCSAAPPISHVPNIISTAVISAVAGENYYYDVEATDTDGDSLTYTLTNYPIGMTIDSFTGLIAWIPPAEGYYEITVQVTDGALFDTQSFTLTVSETEESLSSPAGVEAYAISSPDPYIQITWNPVSSALYYQVYRTISPTGTKTAISKWQPDTSYNNKKVSIGIPYYYWVKAAYNSSGDYASDYSDYDTGKRLGL